MEDKYTELVKNTSRIDVYDDVLSEHDADFLSKIMSAQDFLWHYYHRSDNGQEVYHWHRIAGRSREEVKKNDFEWLLSMWDTMMIKLNFKKKYGIDTFRRIYFNAHTHGIEPQPHRDDGDFTMLYYPLMDWRKDWGGGTTVWNEETTDVEKHVAYTGNRLIVFPAFRLHQAMPVNIDSVSYTHLRAHET